MKIKCVFAAVFLVFCLGCSTAANFRLPIGSTLYITDRQVTPDSEGRWKTSPFFWNASSGAKFKLFDKNHRLIRHGKLKTKFRVASIFWPPFALIYWPFGLKNGEYDLSKPGNSALVKDELQPLEK